jgi:hypothetical protein
MIAGLITVPACQAEHELSGTWTFEKSGSLEGKPKTLRPPSLSTLQFVDGELLMRPKCATATRYDKVELDYSELFQDNVKADISPAAVDKYLEKNFSFDFSKTTHYHRAVKATVCDRFYSDIIASKDRILFLQGGTIYYSYTRAGNSPAGGAAPGVPVGTKKLSQLPFDSAVFLNVCRNLLPPLKDASSSVLTTKCGPVFYPYVATKADTDPLAKLIGSHLYIKNGAIGSKDYDNPVAHNLRPVYFVFPPFKDVQVVAVEDTEQGESYEREGIERVYLAIKDGKVTDQLTGICKLNSDYGCTSDSGKKMYQLLATGKFEKVDR